MTINTSDPMSAPAVPHAELQKRLHLCANLIGIHGADASAVYEAIELLAAPVPDLRAQIEIVLQRIRRWVVECRENAALNDNDPELLAASDAHADDAEALQAALDATDDRSTEVHTQAALGSREPHGWQGKK